MRVSRTAISIVLLGATLFFVVVLFGPKKVRPVSPTVTTSELEVIAGVLSQGELGIGRRHVLQETTTINDLLRSKSYEALSQELRASAIDNYKPTALDSVLDFVTRTKIPQRYTDEFREALEDFLLKNRSGVRILFPTTPPPNVQLVSEETLSEIFSAKHEGLHQRWSMFYERFPDGGKLTRVSRVGIDSKETVAIIYVGTRSGPLAGFGTIYVLERKGKTWILRPEHFGARWVS
jgi:hypothetical protein